MSDLKQRQEERISSRYLIYFGEKEPEFAGFIKNLSQKGLAIVSGKSFDAGTRLTMLLHSRYDEDPISLTGIVRRMDNRLSQWLQRVIGQIEMGIELEEPPNEYLDFIERIIQEQQEVRHQTRFDKVFHVSFFQFNMLLEEVSLNISRGGVFISSTNPPYPGETVQLKIEIEDINESIDVEAQVVRTITPDDAKRRGLVPGFGAKFLHFNSEDQGTLNAFINQMDKRSN